MKRLRNIIIGLIILFVILLLIRVKPKTVVIGHFAGMCIGNCGTMYEIGEKVIARDTTSFYKSYNDLSKFSVEHQEISEQDDEGDYNDLKLGVPLIMLFDPRNRFGCPDCRDQGGYYLQFTMFGLTRRFQIDPGHEPFYYSTLTENIKRKIKKANIELK